jgi:hypothetical protein
MMEFKEFKKIPRLSRECVVTEKIDGTNGVIAIEENAIVWAGSKTRWLWNSKDGMLCDDNYGFASWVKTNIEDLKMLGIGYHYGEWWGGGIQRGYGLLKGEKRFSLFNVHRWSDSLVRPKCCDIVPVIYEGLFDTYMINGILHTMEEKGSLVVPGFMKPEGVVIFHKAGNLLFKKTIEKDDKPKEKNCGGRRGR